MKKQYITYLLVGIVAIILVAGGLYAYRYRSCLKRINYIPPREGTEPNPSVTRGLRYKSVDKGDYYIFYGKEFRTSGEAIRACIWR